MLIILSVLIGIISLGMIIAGALTILRDSKNPQNRWFFGFSSLLGIWTLANFIDSNYLNSHTSLFVKLDFSIILFGVWAALIFAYNFSVLSTQSRNKSMNKYIVMPGLILNLLFGILIFSNLVVETTIKSNSLNISFLPISAAYIILLLTYSISFLGVLFYRGRKTKGLEKSAINLIILGIGIALIANLLTNLVFPSIFSSRSAVKDLNIIGYLGLLVMTVSIYIAITTQKLFNIRLVITRSLGYFTSLTAVLLLFVTPTIIIGAKIANYQLPLLRAVYIILLTSIAVILFQPIKVLFDRLSNKLFYQNYYEIKDVIDRLGNALVGSIEPQEIKNQSIKILSNAVKPKKITFLLSGKESGEDNDLLIKLKNYDSNLIITDETSDTGHGSIYEELQKNEIGLAIRLRARHDDIGFLLFGYLQSGRSFNDTDIRLLSIAADEIAISLQNALRYEEIQGFNVTLQDKIDVATKQLTRANTRLKALDETKDDFISMASHQLRTPLTSVKGYLSMVLEGDVGEVPKDQKKMLAQAFDSSQIIVYLISDLLNISRLQTGKFVIERTECDLPKIIKDEIELVETTAKARDLKIVFHKPANFPLLNLDEIKIRQVIMNFLDNAIYYTPAKGEITVSLEEKQTTVELKVTDTGIGVPASVAHHLFTKFYRAENAKKARPDGTGLGLFMAKKVVIAQGGSIIFSTKENKGSTFGFSLPKKQ